MSKNIACKELCYFSVVRMFSYQKVVNLKSSEQLKFKSFGDSEYFHTISPFYTFIYTFMDHIKIHFYLYKHWNPKYLLSYIPILYQIN